MKSFFIIVAGSVLASAAWVSATYNLYPPDPAFYLSYGGTITLSSVISFVTAAIFFGFFKFFKVRVKSLYWLGGAAFATQLAIEISTHTIFFDLGVLGLAAAALVFPAVANFLLDKMA